MNNYRILHNPSGEYVYEYDYNKFNIGDSIKCKN